MWLLHIRGAFAVHTRSLPPPFLHHHPPNHPQITTQQPNTPSPSPLSKQTSPLPHNPLTLRQPILHPNPLPPTLISQSSLATAEFHTSHRTSTSILSSIHITSTPPTCLSYSSFPRQGCKHTTQNPPYQASQTHLNRSHLFNLNRENLNRASQTSSTTRSIFDKSSEPLITQRFSIDLSVFDTKAREYNDRALQSISTVSPKYST